MISKLFPIFLLCFISSCATYNKNPVTTYENDDETGISMVSGGDNKTKDIVVLNRYKNFLNGKLSAKVEVQNKSSKPSIFLYKFDWIKEDGSVDNSPIWQNATVNGKEMQTLQAIDPRGNAVDFRLLLKGA